MKFYFFILCVLFLFTSNHYVFAENSSDLGDSVEIVISPLSYNQQCETDDNCFLPNTVKSKFATTVTWTNYDDAIHNVVSGFSNSGYDGQFQSELLQSGDTFTHKFDLNGSYSYFCSIHTWMTGTILIGDDDIRVVGSFNSPPEILIDGFLVEEYVTDLDVPITFDFIDSDMFILQKNNGKVILVNNNENQKKTILDLEVSNYGETGLLGITTIDNHVFLFFTEAHHDAGLSLGHKIYKYDWDGMNLSNPELIRDLPGWVNGYHGGALTSDSKKNVFAVTGNQYKFGLTQNHAKSESYACMTPDSACDPNKKVTLSDNLRETLSCMKVSFYHYTTNPMGWQIEQPDFTKNILETNPLNILTNIQSCFERFSFNAFSDGNWIDTGVVLKIFPTYEVMGIGVRNSFGITTDPINNNLWITENGPEKFDEINLISEKFNGGWAKVVGIVEEEIIHPEKEYSEFKYENPKFAWELPIGVSGLDFADSNYFPNHRNWLFVADSNSGNIYYFQLSENRTNFIFESEELRDNIVNLRNNASKSSPNESMNEILFGKNFGVITDLKFGPDGSLYVSSLFEGKIYRIFPE